MALDGIYLHHLKSEISSFAVGSRIEKIHQPSREELVLSLRSREGAKKLLLSCRADSARIHFTEYAPENPAKPPMLCMLLRKHLYHHAGDSGRIYSHSDLNGFAKLSVSASRNR